jgi:hypothetical protein
MQPRSVQQNGCGGPSKQGRIPALMPDRELSIPSPSANLVGIWKGATADIYAAGSCRRHFYFLPYNKVLQFTTG